MKELHQWQQVEKKLHEGNRLIVTDDKLVVYSGRKKIFGIKKTNKYVPVLVKPDL